MTSKAPAPDVVVVGAGVAGATVASLLSSRGASVLVLESGHDDPVPSTPWPDPAAGATVPVPGAPAAGRYVVGRGPGGGSRINGQLLSFGLSGDYAEWSGGWEGVRGRFDALGVPSDAVPEREWAGVDRVLASQLESLGAGRDDGWWRNGRSGTWGPARYAWSHATRTTTWHGLAGSVAVRTGAHVARVLVDGARATGVELRDGRQVRAGRVVLCAGAAATPSLLVASGVAVRGGARDHPAVAIPVRPSLPARPAAHCAVAARLDVKESGDLLVSTWTSGDGTSAAILVAAASGPHGSVGSDGRPVVVVQEGHLEVLDAGLRVALAAIASGVAAGALVDAPCDDAGTSAVDLRSAPPADRRKWISGRISGHWHLGCTAVGSVDDRGAVREAAGLWIADASALPSLPKSGPMASVMAMATSVAESVAKAG